MAHRRSSRQRVEVHRALASDAADNRAAHRREARARQTPRTRYREAPAERIGERARPLAPTDTKTTTTSADRAGLPTRSVSMAVVGFYTLSFDCVMDLPRRTLDWDQVLCSRMCHRYRRDPTLLKLVGKILPREQVLGERSPPARVPVVCGKAFQRGLRTRECFLILQSVTCIFAPVVCALQGNRRAIRSPCTKSLRFDRCTTRTRRSFLVLPAQP
jgi:hypothetical protein